MAILVVGASGATGRLLVEQLLNPRRKRHGDCAIARQAVRNR